MTAVVHSAWNFQTSAFFEVLSEKLDWLPNRFRDRTMVFGTVQWLSEMGIHWLIRTGFEIEKLPLICKIATKAFELFTSFAIAWLVLGAGGYPLTWVHARNVTYLNILYSATSKIVLDYFWYIKLSKLTESLLQKRGPALVNFLSFRELDGS